MSKLGTDEGVAFFIETLADHALVEIRCDHDAKTDTPVCNCGIVALGTHPTVQAAKEAWALHVLDVLTRDVHLDWMYCVPARPGGPVPEREGADGR